MKIDHLPMNGTVPKFLNARYEWNPQTFVLKWTELLTLWQLAKQAALTQEAATRSA